MRGDLLPYWEPNPDLPAAERAGWLGAAGRMAEGLGYLAHLPATVDADALVVAFPCADLRLAADYERAIRRENVEARVVVAGNGVGVALPCRPDATDEEIKHCVLAGVKAAHAVEFIPITDPDVLEQLAAVQAIEACVVNFGRRLRGLGGGRRRAPRP